MTKQGLPPNLVCPTDRSPLGVADEPLLARVNRAISAGRLQNQSGRTLNDPIDGGLVRADQTLLYPILDGIPMLLADEAIPLAGIADN